MEQRHNLGVAVSGRHSAAAEPYRREGRSSLDSAAFSRSRQARIGPWRMVSSPRLGDPVTDVTGFSPSSRASAIGSRLGRSHAAHVALVPVHGVGTGRGLDILEDRGIVGRRQPARVEELFVLADAELAGFRPTRPWARCSG